jgi:hypothetical protein
MEEINDIVRVTSTLLIVKWKRYMLDKTISINLQDSQILIRTTLLFIAFFKIKTLFNPFLEYLVFLILALPY